MQASESGVPGDPSQQLMQPRLDRAGITWLLVVVAGLCWWAAFPPLDVWPLVVISALAVIRAATGARSTLLLLLSAWVVFTLVWLWVQRWTMSVSAPGYPVFAVYLGFYTVLSAWMFRRFGRDPVIGGWPMAIVAPLVIVAVECLRGLVVFGGYPWYYSGHPLIHWPLLVQAADLVGSWWGSILVFSVAGLLFDLLSQERRSTGSLITVCLLLGGSIGYGAWRLGQHDVFVDGPRIVAIQTNLPQDNKVGWSWAAQQQDVPRFIEMTRQAVEAEQPDLVVWPETMIPGLGFESSTTEFIKAAGGGFRLPGPLAAVDHGDLATAGCPHAGGQPHLARPGTRAGGWNPANWKRCAATTAPCSSYRRVPPIATTRLSWPRSESTCPTWSTGRGWKTR